ncbi:MAG TPA: hypothetical protein VMV49_16535 [Candidatus Deferrimicrobium sp.]|nr:hypothetical protein [Candidatus Deferrimicrobium sp.]
MNTQEMYMKEEADIAMLNVKVKKNYLDLFKEICKENKLDVDAELKSRLEEALVDAFSKYSSRCMHRDHALRFLKGGKGHIRKPGFDFTQIEKLLSKMDTVAEQIEWLKNYLQQLQQTRETMYFNSRGLPITMTSAEEQFTSLTPYMEVYPQAVIEVQKKINELEAQQIVTAKIVHKM